MSDNQCSVAKLDTYLATPIPIQLKNILLVNDYDSLAVLKEFDNDCLTEVQDYMRNVFDVTMLNGNENVQNFLGHFVNCQHKFEFTSGQKQWLSIIVKKCNELSSRRQTVSTVESADITENDIESLRHLLQKWTLANELLIEVTQQPFCHNSSNN